MKKIVEFNWRLSGVENPYAFFYTLGETILDDMLERGWTVRHDRDYSTVWIVVSTLKMPEDIETYVNFELVNDWMFQTARVVHEEQGQVYYGHYGREYQPIYNVRGDLVDVVSTGPRGGEYKRRRNKYRLLGGKYHPVYNSVGRILKFRLRHFL